MELDEKPQLSIEVEAGEAEIVIRLVGELDLTTADQLEMAIAKHRSDSDARRLVLDLSALQFMDSSGLAVMIGETAHGREVVLRSPSPIVRDVIRVTGLEAVLPVET